MKIKYKFSDGHIEEIEVNDELGNYITASEKEQANFERRQRYRCPVSIDQFDYDVEFMADERSNPEDAVIRAEDDALIEQCLATLTPLQLSRVKKMMDGMTISEIAAEEGVSPVSIWDSMEGVRKKIKKFFKTT